MTKYIVNKNPIYNPGYHHEVHTQEHATKLGIRDMYDLGYHSDEINAVNAAKRYYRDADGCKICCPKAHHG